jgi:rhodanese-related sulfurtransferase
MEEENGVQVLDVRTESEYLKGHLPNALNINIRDTAFHSRVLELLEKDRPVAVYCRSGNRSKVAGAILVDMGYEVYELNSGVVGWTGKVEY